MNPDYYVEKARRAILTDQPMLAQLYMMRGMAILDQRRRKHLSSSIDGQFTLLAEDLTRVTDMLVNAFTPALQAAGMVFDQFHRNLLEQTQDNFMLVSE